VFDPYASYLSVLLIFVEGLKQYMSQYGPVEHCTIMRDPAGKSRGFGFLTFTNPSSVDKVVATTHNVDGKQVSPLTLHSTQKPVERSPDFSRSSLSRLLDRPETSDPSRRAQEGVQDLRRRSPRLDNDRHRQGALLSVWYSARRPGHGRQGVGQEQRFRLRYL
jgi:RNA recognition motif-containing protein